MIDEIGSSPRAFCHLLRRFIQTPLANERNSQVITRYGKVWVEFDRMTKFSVTDGEIRRRKSNVNETKGNVSFGQVIIELEGFARGFFRFAPTFDWRHGAIVLQDLA